MFATVLTPLNTAGMRGKREIMSVDMTRGAVGWSHSCWPP